MQPFESNSEEEQVHQVFLLTREAKSEKFALSFKSKVSGKEYQLLPVERKIETESLKKRSDLKYIFRAMKLDWNTYVAILIILSWTAPYIYVISCFSDVVVILAARSAHAQSDGQNVLYLHYNCL